MKLYPSQRSALAERICRRFIKRCGESMPVPTVYVIHRKNPRYSGHVWGRNYSNISRGTGKIILHIGPMPNRREMYILLAHEFAHHRNNFTSTARNRGSSHGERFQRILWDTLPYGLWKRASRNHWVRHASAHKPRYQPDRPAREEAGPSIFLFPPLTSTQISV